MTRRRFLATTAAATATLAMPHVSHSQAGGKLAIGFWDHWVPGANNASKELCEEWGAKNKVEVSIDYITSQGHKNLLTIAAEQQARSGHDIIAFPTWEPHDARRALEPVDDIMAELIKQNGAVNKTVEYLARANNRWIAVPACVGSQIKGPCSRIDLLKKHAGIDVQAHVSRRQRAEGRRLDARRHAQGRRGLPQGRQSRSASVSARRRTMSTPPARSSSRSAPRWSTPRAPLPSSPTRCAKRSNIT